MPVLTQFSCEACSRSYTWKPQLAGKRVKCKCGAAVNVPQEQAEPQSEGDGLYDFADIAAADAKAAQHATAAADASGEIDLSRVRKAAAPEVGLSNNTLPRFAQQTLAYQRGQTQQQRDRNAFIVDMPRDVYQPTAVLVVGFLLYIANFGFHYHLGGTALGLVGVGVAIMATVKTALLVGFALLVAGPLGVSFGTFWTAILKLAAIAVFSDGCTAWVDQWVGKMAPGMGGAFLSFPVSVGIYWGLMIHFFQMDLMEARLVVVLLNLFSFILKWAIILFILTSVFSLGGKGTTAALATGDSSSAALSERSQEVEELREAKCLKEARAYIADGHQAFLTQTVDKMYDAGAKKIYFSVTRDINGHGDPTGIYIEMPKSIKSRQEIIALRKKFYEANKMFVAPEDEKDEPEEQYLEMRIR